MKILINAILIIILLHLIIKNIELHKTFNLFGVKESFANEDDSLNFLQDISDDFSIENFDNNCSSKSFLELVDYVNKCDDKNVIRPGNYYATDENTSNFKSNVLNVNKFYNRNEQIPGSYEGLEGEQLQNLSKTTLNDVKDQTCFPMRNKKQNLESVQPDNWNYKNELPMNGGNILKNVSGFDNLNTGYASYNQNTTTSNPDCGTYRGAYCGRQADDIRFGLGYPNKEYRETN